MAEYFIKPATRSILKLVYLILALQLLVFLSAPYVLISIAVLQAGLWMNSNLSLSVLLSSFKRLSVFFVVIFLSYTVFNVGENPHILDLRFIELKINEDGAEKALLMCLRVFLMVWASVWVQKSEKTGEMATALRKIGLSELLATAIDSTLYLLTGDNGRKKNGSGKGKKNKVKISFRQIMQGDFSYVTDRFLASLEKATKYLGERYPTLAKERLNDLTVVVGVSAAIMGLKLIQLMPGLPVAPGHKNIIIIPFFLAAAAMTHSRFGGLMTGLTVGIVSVMMGFGKFGIFEISHFAIPGLLADLLFPFIALNAALWIRFLQLSLIGMIMGFGRFSANFLVILLAGAPEGAFILYLPMLFSQIIFGGLSVFVSLVILKIIIIKNNSEKDQI